MVVTRLTRAKSDCARRSASWARVRDSPTRRFTSISAVINNVAITKTAKRTKVAVSWAGGNVLHRKKCSNAKAERATDKRPGPNPPKRLLTVTASRKHDEGASIGHASTSATPQEIIARP